MHSSDNENSGEVDIFELTVTPPPTEPIETETNSYPAETLRQAMAHPHAAAGADVGEFDFGPSPQNDAEDDFDVGPSPQEEVADEFADIGDGAPGQKSGFLSKLFRKIADKVEQAGGSLLNNDAARASSAPDEPVAADSGVFEMTVPAGKPAEGPSAPDEPVITDSGVFEMAVPAGEPAEGPSMPDEPVAAASGVFETAVPAGEPAEEPSAPGEPVITDSGVFEMAVPAEEPAATDSGVFELNASPAEPAAADSGVFEISQPQAEEPASAEWEIGWEPEDGSPAEAEFDVSAAAPQAEEKPLPPPPLFTKIAHVCIYVENLERSVEYYSKIGFQKRFAFNKNGKLFGIYLEFGGGNFIEIFEDASRSAEAPGKLAHFCLETPDIDAATESLTARGVEFTPKKLGSDSTYQIWLKDPDGNSFEIHQYTPDSSQIVGIDVEADW
ncbi:MAG: VOC family protein [Chitinispirillales bacterium]|jgi:lactoylglutathione lyase/glyoxylase I family protein|nr:VOC family protein [Chitinispirillales bacterium]